MRVRDVLTPVIGLILVGLMWYGLYRAGHPEAVWLFRDVLGLDR